VIHSFNNACVDEHVVGEVGFLITNKKGNYLSLGRKNFTHMQGLFFFDNKKWELYKTIENIEIDRALTGIRNNLFNVKRIYKGGVEESFSLFNNSMIYSVKNYAGELLLELDFRAMFDYDDQGRIYTVTQEDEDFIIIRYDKFTDNSLCVLDKTCFLVIKGAKDFRLIDRWVKKNYSYDAERNTRSEFYVYQALSIRVDKDLNLVFSFSDNKEEAMSSARMIYDNRQYLFNSIKNYVAHAFTSRDLALNTAMKALDDLLISAEVGSRTVGVIAGLPWFCQFWARDELISLKALMLQGKYYLVKSILFKYLKSISDDGLIPTRLPGSQSDVKSVDAVGWLFLRVKDYIKLLVSKKIINDYLSVSDFVIIKRALEKTILGLSHYHSSDGLIINDEQETWMDTLKAERAGACIEVQALFLSMINLHNLIASITKSKPLFRSLENEVRQRVRKVFFTQNRLYDCVPITASGSIPSPSHSPIRPNVFLAYYIYPELLTRKEWRRVFDDALKELWLGWGGLSTLSHKSSLFRCEHSGEDNASYHNGDSWYYINNYAALAMHRLDKKYYADKIKRIVGASKEEMFFSGFVGCCAELSSAKHMQSRGCLSQAWSAASLIELLYELGSSS